MILQSKKSTTIKTSMVFIVLLLFASSAVIAYLLIPEILNSKEALKAYGQNSAEEMIKIVSTRFNDMVSLIMMVIGFSMAKIIPGGERK